MEVIFIKDTRENPAHKQIKSITSSYDYVDAYVFDDKINYFGKLPQAPIGGYIYDQRLEGTLQSFELENLITKGTSSIKTLRLFESCRVERRRDYSEYRMVIHESV